MSYNSVSRLLIWCFLTWVIDHRKEPKLTFAVNPGGLGLVKRLLDYFSEPEGTIAIWSVFLSPAIAAVVPLYHASFTLQAVSVGRWDIQTASGTIFKASIMW
jgi:hypothetical protein